MADGASGMVYDRIVATAKREPIGPSDQELSAIARDENAERNLAAARRHFLVATNAMIAASQLPADAWFLVQTICLKVDLAVEKGDRLGPVEIARLEAACTALAEPPSMLQRYANGTEIVRKFAPRVIRCKTEKKALTETLRTLCALTENVDRRFLYDPKFFNGGIAFVKDLSEELRIMRSFSPRKPAKGQRSDVGVLAALALHRGVWTEEVRPTMTPKEQIEFLRNRIAVQISQKTGKPMPRRKRA